MKKLSFVLAILAAALVFGLALSGCTTDSPEPAPYEGVWADFPWELTISDGNFTMKIDGINNAKGTYSEPSSAELVFTTTHCYLPGESWAGQIAQYPFLANYADRWINRSELASLFEEWQPLLPENNSNKNKTTEEFVEGNLDTLAGVFNPAADTLYVSAQNGGFQGTFTRKQ